MFQPAELGQTLSAQEYKKRVPELRQQLLEAQADLREAGFPVIVLFGGVDGAGKGESANLLSKWTDPRWLVTRAFDKPTDEERERPRFWRFWRCLPPKQHLGIFLSAWYHAPLMARAYGQSSPAEFEQQLDRIVAFEKLLVDDGALVLKFWMHLGMSAQRERFERLESDPRQKWRVTKSDWKHWRMYDAFAAAAECLIRRTSTPEAPWRIIEGSDRNYYGLRVGTLLLEGLRWRLSEAKSAPATPAPSSSGIEAPVAAPTLDDGGRGEIVPILSQVDTSKTLKLKTYRSQLKTWQGRLNRLHRKARRRKVSTLVVFEGWDAAGKGGAIRRVTAALDSRDYQVIPIAAPTDEEAAQHYLWRFWRHLPRAGRVTIFDRSWYGRVLVERVEGFAAESEWQRAYTEINHFEEELMEYGVVLLKYFIHISPDEQEKRFTARREIPYKRWKLTEEDWRNRERWSDYEAAVNEMVERTSTSSAPWTLVEGDDKRYARIKVLKTLCRALGQALE